MVEMAGVYGDALALTCILQEGNITVTSGSLVESGKMGTNTYSFATQVNEGDFVSLDETALINTYANTGGIPVVKAADATDGWIGIVKSQPVWNKIPTADQTTWNAARLTNGFFRVATIVFPGLTMAFKALGDGGTDIEVGMPLKWDASEDAFVTAGTTVTGAFSFHAAADDNLSILVGIGPHPALLNTDMTGYLGAA